MAERARRRRLTALYPAERLAAGGGRHRGGRAGCAAAHPRPGPALRDRLRRAAAGAAHLPRAPRVGATRSWWCRGWNCPRRRPRPPARPGWRWWPGTRRTIRTRWSRGGSALSPRWAWPTACGPMMVLRFARRAARCRAGPGQRRAARAAVAQEPRRGGRAPRRPAPPSTGCTPRCRAGCGRAGPSSRSPRTSPPRSPAKATPARTSSSSRPGRTRPARTTSRRARVLQPGDAVVVDIGGTMPSGYCSDCTRVYAIGGPAAAVHRVLRGAARRPGGGVRGGPPRRHRRGGRRGGPGADHRGRVRARVRAPDRARDRAGDPRGPVHRGGQRRAARARHGLLHRAGDLPRPARRRIEDIVVCTDQGTSG